MNKENDSKKKTILIIEDEEMIVEMYERKLREVGYRVLTARTANEGWQITKKQRPDLVLLDIRLPGESGVSYLQKLREDSDVAKTKVLVISNFDEPRTREIVKRLGGLAYLIKANYTPNEMIEKIGSYL